MEYVNERYISKGLSANNLKFIAILAMVLNHTAVVFVPKESFMGQLMYGIGRITMPIMCYFIAEGYYKTSNIRRYILRLSIFTIIAHYAFFFFATGVPPISFNDGIRIQIQFPTSVIFTLLLGLIALNIWNNKKINICLKLIFIFIICIFSIGGDWGYTGVLWTLVFGANHGEFKNQIIGFLIVSIGMLCSPIISFVNINNSLWWWELYQLGLLLTIPLLAQYNGKLGVSKNTKWTFYIFYPLHLLLLGYLKYCI
ncbi:TraX family protein [Clostridium sp. LIBA-8841]|uniref:TraX family protein n=1 Tax=Clostridium sp. LIBA-8841 TaxID=2987530 RepID=UPI002AC54DED|nr:TraX family protein [Clostridium sp. LIBA-8841]MDZ5252730.1 conjugal transfer protein TraX [Clostridium sp. LIBA-8841]